MQVAGGETERNKPAVSMKEQEKILFDKLSSLSLTPEVAEEFTARIKKRFILFPDQIYPKALEGQKKAEAKGLDFIGKVRLIEQALESGKEILEIIERSSSGTPKRILLAPMGLDKSQKELVLVGKPLPRGDTIRIEVRKLSLIRKLQSALYAP